MATVTLDRAGLERLLVSPTGPVMLEMRRRGNNVLEIAQQTCPVFLGDLRSSLKVVVTRDGARNVVEVGSDLPELLFVEKGTGPGHEPDPNPPYFPPWDKPDFALWAVDHGFAPFGLALHINRFGTKATNFLRDALRQGVVR